MARASASSKAATPRRLPRGRHALAPEDVLRAQRERLTAGLDALASDPDTARILFVEAPSAGEEIALRYHEWLGRYGSLLRAAAPDLSPESIPAPEVEGVIVGGIASRVASEVLNDRAAKLGDLTAPLVEYVLAFYRIGEPGPERGQLVTLEGREVASEPIEARRKQASA